MRKLLLISLPILLLLWACDEFKPNHSFYEGQCVQMKLDGMKGIVIIPRSNRAWVRFAATAERTDTHILGDDGNIRKSPYEMILVYSFELEPCA